MNWIDNGVKYNEEMPVEIEAGNISHHCLNIFKLDTFVKKG